jgi:hypothetical protein
VQANKQSLARVVVAVRLNDQRSPTTSSILFRLLTDVAHDDERDDDELKRILTDFISL